MYNEKQKLAFIKDTVTNLSTEDLCRNVFNSLEKYEEEWGADLCTKTSDELRPVIEQLVGFRVHSKWTRIILLRKYVNWCIVNGVPGAIDGVSGIDTLGLSKVRTMTVFTPAALQDYLNCICEPESEKTVDNIYRCYYWLAFSGMDEEDIMNVKTNEVDFENMLINHDGRSYIIYRESIPAFKNCVNLTEFVYKHPNYSKDVIKNRVPGDTLIRGVKRSISTMAMRTELSRRAKKFIDSGETNIKLSYYRAWISGLFYRTYEAETRGISPSFKGAAERFMEGKVYKLDSGRNTPEAKKRQIMNDYLQDYERWKAAHTPI